MRKALAGVVLPLAIGAIAVGPVLFWWSRLPDEIAVHWDGSGRPDGHMGRVAGLLVPTVIAVVGAVIVAVAARHGRGATTVSAAALAGFFAGLFAAISLATVLANRDVRRWQDADLPVAAIGPLVLAALVSAATVLAGLRPRWLAPLASDREGSTTPGGERVAWAGGCHSGWVLFGGAALCGLTALALGLTGTPVVAIELAGLGALIALSFGSVRVVVGANGVRVTPGYGWPRVTIPLTSIDRAEAITVNPLDWGGWGYRGSLRLMGRAAWVLRRGEGLRLDLTDGRTFAVTVDHADEAATVVNEWLSRLQPAGSPS